MSPHDMGNVGFRGYDPRLKCPALLEQASIDAVPKSLLAIVTGAAQSTAGGNESLEERMAHFERTIRAETIRQAENMEKLEEMAEVLGEAVEDQIRTRRRVDERTAQAVLEVYECARDYYSSSSSDGSRSRPPRCLSQVSSSNPSTAEADGAPDDVFSHPHDGSGKSSFISIVTVESLLSRIRQ